MFTRSARRTTVLQEHQSANDREPDSQCLLESPWMDLFPPHTVDAVAEELVRRRSDVFALAACFGKRRQANKWGVQTPIKEAAALTE